MPPKPSKKKAPKKQVNRGFATTSIPKKVSESDPPASLSDQDATSANTCGPANQPSALGSSTLQTSDHNGSTINKDDPLKIAQDEWEQDPEDRETQSLAERLRAISEKEIAKQFKIIEYDKRLAKGWTGFRWSDTRLQHDILEYAQANQPSSEHLALKQMNTVSGGFIDDDEKILQKMLVLYGILDRLGFSRNRIDDCLGKIKALEFEDAIDYLLLNCSNEELILAGYEGLSSPDSSAINADKDTQINDANLKIPSTSQLDNNHSNMDNTSLDASNSDSDLSNFPARTRSSATLSVAFNDLEIEHDVPDRRLAKLLSPGLSADLKHKIVEYGKFEDEHRTSTEDPPTMIEEYVALKLSIMELCKKNSRMVPNLKSKALKDAAKIKKEMKLLEDKVKLVQASYMFDQKEADQALKAKLKGLKQAVGFIAIDDEMKKVLGSEAFEPKEEPNPPSPSLPITAMQSHDEDDELSHCADAIPPADPPNPSSTNSPILETSRGSIHSNSQIPTSPLPPPNHSEAREDSDAGTETGEDSGMFGITFEEPVLSPSSTHGLPGLSSHGHSQTSPESKKAQTTTVLIVRDMPLPRQLTGKTPQNLLDEALRRLDKDVQPRYFVISRGTRAIRASVEIKWNSRKMIGEHGGKTNSTAHSASSGLGPNQIQTFTMEDEACRDETQAFNYVATLALFYLNTLSSSTVHRHLPATFRELWDELEEKRKKVDEQNYFDLVKNLQCIAKKRVSNANNLNIEEPPTSRPPKQSITSPSAEAPNIGAVSNNHQPYSEQADLSLMQEFALRQQWHSYQVMLGYRATLPIAVFRSLIVTAVDQNQVVVLCGETGCGKSTQLPAFLLEHEMSNGRPVKILCTEPRRISAISLAQRVSQELGEPVGAVGQVGSLVGYNIRLESKTSVTSRLIYATTGVVLRMLENGTDLQGITHLIIDEVHERSIDSDFLLIALKTILERRPNLRVVLMSATVDADKISNYMNQCPVLQVPGRTFPVTSFFLEDVIELTDYKLDARSDSPYISRQSKRKPILLRTASNQDDVPTLDDDDEITTEHALAHTYAQSTRATLEVLDEHQINMDLIVLLLSQICFQTPGLVHHFSSAILIFLPSLDTIRKLTEILEGHPNFGTTAFQIFPLHSSISNENQSLVFQTPPPGVRKIVISTNIAETGITIPDVTCVIDSGKHREMRYDEKRQISRLVETFIAKSNATQRKGRAGRVQEGICFHLFTKHRLETQFADNPLPEMLRLSLQDLALRIKTMKIGTSIEDVLSQALDPPSTANVQRAIASLVEVRALTPAEEITPLGRHLVKLPMDVHMGKLLILGCLFRCLSPALTVAAALNSKSPFLTPFGREQEADTIKRSFKVENSDFLTICKVYDAWRQAYRKDHVHQFCRKNMLSHSNLLQIEELRLQFFSFLLDAGFVEFPSSHLRRSKFCDVPSKLDLNAKQPKIVMGCIGAAMFPKVLVQDGTIRIGSGNSNAQGGWRTLTNSAPASIHPSSVNFTSGRRPDFGDARFVTYFNIMQSKKLYVWESGVVDEKAIFLLCGEADFKMPAQSIIIDRKIKSSMDPKTLLVLKILRQRFQHLFNLKMRNPSKPFNEQQQRWFDMIAAAIRDDKDVPTNNQSGDVGDLPKVDKKIKVSVILTPAAKTLPKPENRETHIDD